MPAGPDSGWEPGRAYRVRIVHRPKIGIIRLKIWQGERLLVDSQNLIDNGAQSLRGGRLGVFSDSQALVTWSALTYRCT